MFAKYCYTWNLLISEWQIANRFMMRFHASNNDLIETRKVQHYISADSTWSN